MLRTRTALTTSGDEAISLYLRVAQLCEEGTRDIDAAIEAYRRILDIAPSHREALDALARLYEGTERWAELVEISRRQARVVTDRAHKALIYFRCGSVMESKFGKDEEAIRYYDAAIKTSATCLPAVHGLRDLYLRREDWPRVVQTLELESKLWTEDKERAGIYAHMGALYADKLADLERAIEYYESALSVDRECLPANRALFELYFRRGEYARALPLGSALTQKVMREGDPAERSEFYRKRAVVARATGDVRGAAESLVVGLEIRPENLEALDLLVDLCRSDGSVWDYAGTFAQLDKLYRKRGPTGHVEAPVPASPQARLLARLCVGQSTLCERDIDIEGAERLLDEALHLAPDDFPVVDAEVNLALKLRRHQAAARALELYLVRSRDRGSRTQAALRLAAVFADHAMTPERAVAVLQALLSEEPTSTEAHFRLAQELYLLGRHAEAQRVCERLIELAAAPGRTAPPEDLARYYDYLGRTAEVQGDAPTATRSYRRAIDLDPSYPPPVHALARRFAAAGDLPQGLALVEKVISGLPRAAEVARVELERGLARLHASFGDPREAARRIGQLIAAQQSKRAQQGSGAIDRAGPADSDDDRILLAELSLTSGELDRAADELARVLDRDIRSGLALRLMARIYERAGRPDRAARVVAMLRLLGYPELVDTTLRNYMATARRGTITEQLRHNLLLPRGARTGWAEAFETIHDGLETIFPVPHFGDGQVTRDLSFAGCATDVKRLMSMEAEVRLARGVPGGVLGVGGLRPMVVLEGAWAELPDGERRFVLGRALETMRGGYSLLFRLRPTERAEVERLLSQLFKAPADRDAPAEEFFRSLPRAQQRGLDRALSGGVAPEQTFADWLEALGEAASRAGLVACDDVAAAARALARLGGEELAVSEEGAVLLGQVPGGAELVRFFLSDAYDAVRASLDDPTNS